MSSRLGSRPVRKAALVPLLMIALVLAACGGGGSSSSNGSSAPAASADAAEAAWAKEVQSVMTAFENNVSAAMVEAISTSSAQGLLEPLYSTYAIHLARLAAQLEATKAPPACVQARKKIAIYGRRVAALNKVLGEREGLAQNAYSRLVVRTGSEIRKNGRQLTSLTAKPSC
jgi:hypothetical protein